jgi:hypothetical protein
MALLSRVADRMYWAARYVERAEDSARVLRSYGDVLADLPTSSTRWSPLVSISGSGVKLPAVSGSDESQVAQFLIADREHPNSIVNTVESCSREPADVPRGPAARSVADPQRPLDLRARCCGHVGRTSPARPVPGAGDRREPPPRRGDDLDDDPRRGVRDVASRPLHRTRRHDHPCARRPRRLAAVAPAGAVDEFAEVQWMGVLRSLSALQMYQRATNGPIDGPAVVRFLLFDHRFPRSVAGCLAEMRTSILRLPEYSTVLGAVEAADRQLRRSRPAADDGVRSTRRWRRSSWRLPDSTT